MNWKQLKGIVRQRWGRLTAGGRIQSAQAIATQADAKQIADWLAREHKADPIHQ